MTPNAIFFDMDGTLFDSKADLAATVNHTRSDLSLSQWPADQILQHVGQGARYLLEHAIPEVFGSNTRPDLADRAATAFKRHYDEHCCERVLPYPGVVETLNELRSRGWLLGINTNKPRFAVRKILRAFDLSPLFGDAIVAGGDNVPLKPDPGSLRACASLLGNHVLTADDWMVGDSWTDMRAAEAAGIRSAFCAFGFGRLNNAPHTVRLDCFADLLSAVG